MVGAAQASNEQDFEYPDHLPAMPCSTPVDQLGAFAGFFPVRTAFPVSQAGRCPRLSSSKAVDRRSLSEWSSPSNKASPAGSCIHRSVSIVEWDEDLPSGGLRGE